MIANEPGFCWEFFFNLISQYFLFLITTFTYSLNSIVCINVLHCFPENDANISKKTDLVFSVPHLCSLTFMGTKEAKIPQYSAVSAVPWTSNEFAPKSNLDFTQDSPASTGPLCLPIIPKCGIPIAIY